MSGFVSTEIRLDRNNLLESTLSDPGEVGDIFKLGYTYYRIVRKYRYAELVNHAIVENVSYLDYVIKQYPHILSRKHPFFDKIKSIEHNPDISWACPKEWFYSMVFITERGYAFSVKDVMAYPFSEDEDSLSFKRYLTGVLDAARVYCRASNINKTLDFILRFLREGRIEVFEHNGKSHFLFRGDERNSCVYSPIEAKDYDN